MTTALLTVPIALVDDHTLMRKGLAELIQRTRAYRVVMQASNGQEFIEALKDGPEVEIAIVDLNMPVMDGYATISWIRANRPSIRTLALTFDGTEEAVIKAMRCGARGFILKDIEPQELKTALEHLHTSGYYHTDLVHHSILEGVERQTSNDRERTRVFETLSAREQEFLKLVCSEEEMTYEEIATAMAVHRRTIDGFRESLFDKYNIKSKTGLVLFAIKWGIVRV